MVKPGHVLFYAALGWFAYGAWVYENLDWTHYPNLFQGGAAFLLGTGIFLLWVPTRRGQKAPRIGALLVLFLFLLSITPLAQKVAWVGSATRKMTFKAVDALSGSGVSATSIRVYRSVGNDKVDMVEALCDADGQTMMDFEFGATGSSSLWRQTGGFSLSGVKIEAQARGYDSKIVELEETIAGNFRRLDAPPIPVIEIALQKLPNH